MDHIEPRDAIEALETLPADMESAYTETLERIDKTKAKCIAVKIMSWLFHAQRPLLMDELREALSVRTVDTQLFPHFLMQRDSLIRYCQGLIIFDEKSGIVRFTHYTVQEFLEKRFRENLLSFVDLAKVCLTYLTFDVFDGPCPNKESFDQRLKSHRFSCYAVQFWGFYTRGHREADHEVRTALFRLFRSPQRCAAIRQLQLFVEGERRAEDNVEFSLSVLKWTPLHYIAQEGLMVTYNSNENVFKLT